MMMMMMFFLLFQYDHAKGQRKTRMLFWETPFGRVSFQIWPSGFEEWKFSSQPFGRGWTCLYKYINVLYKIIKHDETHKPTGAFSSFKTFQRYSRTKAGNVWPSQTFRKKNVVFCTELDTVGVLNAVVSVPLKHWICWSSHEVKMRKALYKGIDTCVILHTCGYMSQ